MCQVDKVGTQTAGGARGGIVVYTTNKATAGTFGIGGKSDHDYSPILLYL